MIKFVSYFRQFSASGPPVSSTNKTDRHDVTDILLKVALSTIKQTNVIFEIIHGSHIVYGISGQVTLFSRCFYIVTKTRL